MARHHKWTEILENEVFSSFDPNPARTCTTCGKKPPRS